MNKLPSDEAATHDGLARRRLETIEARLRLLAERASDELGRPVAIEDREMRLRAYTAHEPDDEIDDYRMLSILKRENPPEWLAWLDEHGRWTASEPFRVPANDRLRSQARVAAPIRCQGRLYGWVWCLDSREAMTAADLARMQQLADEAGVAMQHEELLLDADRGRERALVEDLLAGAGTPAAEAAAELMLAGLFVPTGRVAAIVVPVAEPPADAEEGDVLALEAAVMRAQRLLSPRHALQLVQPGHAVLVVALADPVVQARGLADVAHAIGQEAASGAAPPPAAIGVGGSVPSLATAHTSYRQALRASAAGAWAPAPGPVVAWDDLGVYQLLAELPLGELGEEALPRGLRELLAQAESRELVRTLETYLDSAGDMRRTAASLYMHRTTVYHRLRRIEQLIEMDLASGDDRLVLHIGLKVARMLGAVAPEVDP